MELNRTKWQTKVDRAMSEQAKKTLSSQDLLAKEYHDIGINAISAACCVKKHREEKHTDYDSRVAHS